MSFTLDTPAQISMWVLLSRRHQIRLHLKGYPQKGLAACLKREFPEVHGRLVKDFVVPVEFAICEAGGEADYNIVNVHVMEKTKGGMYFRDMGIFDSMDAAGTPENREKFAAGLLEVVLTTEAVRDAIPGRMFTGA